MQLVNINFFAEKKGKTMDSRKTLQGRRRDDLRYQLFAEAYLDISNRKTYLKAMQSALKAGYSESYAKHHSYKLVDQRGVQDWMKRIRDSRLKRSTIATPEEILETLTQQIRTLPNELVNENGEFIALHKLTRDQAQAIAGYKETSRVITAGDDIITETKREYRLVDRQKAAEMLAKHHGLLEKDNMQQAPEPVKLVMMPTGDLTLEEWTQQVEALNAARIKTASPQAAA
jgi:phage terminase small subunit